MWVLMVRMAKKICGYGCLLPPVLTKILRASGVTLLKSCKIFMKDQRESPSPTNMAKASDVS